MKKLVKHRAPKRPFKRHVHAADPWLVSGCIYSLAAIFAIALGFVFFRNISRARSGMNKGVSEESVASGLPPNVKVVGRHELQSRLSQAVSTVPKPEPGVPKTNEPIFAEPAAEKEFPLEVKTEQALGSPTSAPTALVPVPPAAGVCAWKPDFGSVVQMETAQLFPKADAAIIASQRGDVNINAGAATNLPIRGNEAFLLAQYDVTPVRGWTILGATWVAKMQNAERARLGFSAVMTPWREGSGVPDSRSSNGCTFAWADFPKVQWREDGLPFSYMIRGNGGTLFSLGEPLPEQSNASLPAATDGWVRLSIDPAIVQAMVAGRAHGLAVSDEIGQLGETWWVPSREADKSAHYLVVEGARADILPPGTVKNLRVTERPLIKGASATGVLLEWTATGDDSERGQAFGYDIRWAPAPCDYNTARPLPFYKTPFPRESGQPERVVLDELMPDTTYTFFVRSIDEVGQVGSLARIDYHTSPALPSPEIPPPAFYDADAVKILNGRLTFRCLDELDPVSLVGTDGDVARKSMVWDRSARTIRLRAARNETIGFVIQLQRTTTNSFPVLRLTLDTWSHPKHTLDIAAAFHRVWFSRSKSAEKRAGWVSDALIPLPDGRLHALQPDNRIPNAARQFVWTELRPAANTLPGKYVGRLVVADEMAAVTDTVNVVLEILPIELVRDPTFVVELSTPPLFASLYRVASENTAAAASLEQAYHRLTREHGCILTIIGPDARGWAPVMAGSGKDLRVTSWDTWDAHMVARDTAGGQEPMPMEAGAAPVVLPFSESWPVYWRDHFVCKEKLQKNRAGFEVYVGDDANVSHCLSDTFWNSWRRVLQEMRDHVASAGARERTYHVWFMNNSGPDPRHPPWNLGVLTYRHDVMAIETFGRVICSEAQKWPSQQPLLLRAVLGDASLLPYIHPGMIGVLCLSETTPAVWDSCRMRARETGESFWYRSPATEPEDGPADMAGMVLRAEMLGASGWSIEETLGRPEDWSRSSARSVIYCGAPLKTDRPYSSLRLTALRRALQDLACLRLLGKKEGWTREQEREFLRREIPSLTQPRGHVVPAELHAFRAGMQERLIR